MIRISSIPKKLKKKKEGRKMEVISEENFTIFKLKKKEEKTENNLLFNWNNKIGVKKCLHKLILTVVSYFAKTAYYDTKKVRKLCVNASFSVHFSSLLLS